MINDTGQEASRIIQARRPRLLLSALAPLALHVEHIGSTAIPGMAAKPVFDLQPASWISRRPRTASTSP
ncbi:GrpB family protein [Nonomuraea sp. NPDC049152]|uniref:GrpB family protein n=1 Tax=Nonomuraea sp. NPDC049152 TaxID=3154350 RepID=UPI0033D0A00F